MKKSYRNNILHYKKTKRMKQINKQRMQIKAIKYTLHCYLLYHWHYIIRVMHWISYNWHIDSIRILMPIIQTMYTICTWSFVCMYVLISGLSMLSFGYLA